MQNRKSTVLFTLCLTSFLVPYMGSSLNLALPEIAIVFNLDAKNLGWINSSFLIATAVFQVPLAKIADALGRKKMFMGGVMLFGSSSAACAFAWNFHSLIAFRVFSGIGGAMVFGTNLAILSASYEQSERGRAMGILSSVVYIALAAGPFFGGIFTHYFGWKSVFYIPGAILLIQAFAIPLLIKHEWIEQGSGNFDKIGSLIYGISLFCLIFGFSELMSAEAITLLVFGILGFFIFYNYEKKISSPVFQVSLFKNNRAFVFASLSAFFSYAATTATTFMLSLYLQITRGFDAKNTGLILVSSAVVQSIASLYAGRLADKFEPSKIASLGMGLNVVGLFGLIFIGIESSIFIIIAMLLFLGLGFGSFSSPNTKVTATVGTMRLAGQAFSMGVAVMAIGNFGTFMQSWRFTFALCSFFCMIGTYLQFFIRKK